jgi:hypothetical protein
VRGIDHDAKMALEAQRRLKGESPTPRSALSSPASRLATGPSRGAPGTERLAKQLEGSAERRPGDCERDSEMPGTAGAEDRAGNAGEPVVFGTMRSSCRISAAGAIPGAARCQASSANTSPGARVVTGAPWKSFGFRVTR